MEYLFFAKDTDEMVGVGAKLLEIIINYSGGARILFMEGDLGAGKTTLTSGIGKKLGVAEEITSPSFVVNKKYYKNDELLMSHYDFYRLGRRVGIMKDELAEDVAEGAFVVVEWGGEIGEILPRKYWKVTIENDGEARKIELKEVSAEGEK